MLEQSPTTAAVQLEVIDKGTCTLTHPIPLLFVHGSWHGAWCWDDHFLDFFAGNGYRALAVSLRGHGESPLPGRLRSCSCTDYVNDVRAVAESLPAHPVLIGHSMGGYVVQKYLESRAAPAGVLLGSMSTRGIQRLMLRLATRHPWLVARSLIAGKSVACVNTPARARELLFSAGVPGADVVRHVARLREESQRVLLDGMVFNVSRPARVATPLLVLGGEHDRCFTPKDVNALACSYRTEAEIFPAMGHDMMLEPGWEAVAERIHAWLGSRGL
ncbi:alpha/beta hydrolase [Mycobacterium sp. pUA109]|uniref:alpha/beta hydrolase n=1 Tax=Mycobacterium sp. pUA109 TaxID=3238982 RepID=UPI00351BC1FF